MEHRRTWGVITFFVRHSCRSWGPSLIGLLLIGEMALCFLAGCAGRRDPRGTASPVPLRGGQPLSSHVDNPILGALDLTGAPVAFRVCGREVARQALARPHFEKEPCAHWDRDADQKRIPVDTLSEDATAYIPYDVAVELVERHGRLPDHDSYLETLRPFLPSRVTTIADVGAASGRMTAALDALTTEAGTIYSVDTDRRSQVFREWYLVQGRHRNTVVAVQNQPENPCLPVDGVDAIFFYRLGYYVTLGDPKDDAGLRRSFRTWYGHVARALRKPDGRLIVVDGIGTLGDLDQAEERILEAGPLALVAKGRIPNRRWWYLIFRPK